MHSPQRDMAAFLVISLGNPGALSKTLHSTGHLVLEAVQRQLQSRPQTRTQPPFTSTHYGGKSCRASLGPKYLLVQSPTFMNTCGPWVARAWREARAGGLSHEPRLVLVHDDLEGELGVVKTRKWERSARGHNGVKSVQASLRAGPETATWARISVGIGRPGERDQTSVSDYVLRPASAHVLSVINDSAVPAVLQALLQLEH